MNRDKPVPENFHAQTHRVECSGKLWNKNHTRTLNIILYNIIYVRIVSYTYIYIRFCCWWWCSSGTMILMAAFLLNLIVFARAQHRGVFATTRIILYIVSTYYIIYGAATYNSAYHIILYLPTYFIHEHYYYYYIIYYVRRNVPGDYISYIYVTKCRSYAAEVVCSAESPTTLKILIYMCVYMW